MDRIVKNPAYPDLHLKARLKRTVFSLDLKEVRNGADLMYKGKPFHSTGPNLLKARSPQAVLVRGC